MFGMLKEKYNSLRLSIRHLNRIDPNVMIFVTYGMLYDMMLNMYSPFTAKYMTRLGGGSLGISLLNSLPGAVAIFVLLPGIFIVRRFTAKKRITAIFFLLSRLLLLFSAFIPFLPREYRALTFLALMALMNFPNAVSQTSLQSFLGTVFDGRMRSTAISMRTKFGNILIPFVTLTTGLLIGYIPQTEAQFLLMYQIFFVIAFIVGLFEIRTFLRFNEKTPDEPMAREPLREQLSVIKDVFRDKKFTGFLVPVIFFYFAWHAGWALGSIYFLEDLAANEFWVAIFNVLTGIGSFLVATRWNRLIHKKGNDFTLFIAAIGITLNMFLYMAMWSAMSMSILQLFSGAVSTGCNIAILNGLLGATPDKNRMVYIGVFNTFMNISLAIAPLVSQVFINIIGTRLTLGLVGLFRIVALVPLLFYILKRRRESETEAAA